MKNRFFNVCPKSGRITGIKKEYTWMKIFFPVAGLAALLWYLIRVLPKPARALYPCQRIAGPLALSFLTALLSWTGIVVLVRKAKKLFIRSKFILAALCCIMCLSLVVWNMDLIPSTGFAYTPSDSPNNPMGQAKGIYPGRVVWINDTAATTYTGAGSWFNDTGTNQAACDAMLSTALQRLSGKTTDRDAWDALFKYFNSNHGSGNTGYQAGEKIAIKINCNNTTSYTDADDNIDASPHTLLAMLKQLINTAGVAQDMITVYDASRPIADRIYNKCNSAFPGVVWVDSQGNNGRKAVVWQRNVISYAVTNSCGPDLPDFLASTKYLINLSLMKCHALAGVTLTAKNHYGSLSAREHTYIMSSNVNYGSYNPLVDLIGHKDLGGKTVLFMVDGLYGTPAVSTNISGATSAKWAKMFNNDYSSSYFLSQDPVAIDSVALDFLNAEFGSDPTMNRSDNYMHEAAQANSHPSGSNYAPSGTKLTSLGVHEHWNNATDKKYTRNLGTGNGIELVTAASITPTATPTIRPGTRGDVNGDGSITIVDALMIAQYSVGLNPPGFIAANADTNQDGTINVVDALRVAQYVVGLIPVL